MLRHLVLVLLLVFPASQSFLVGSDLKSNSASTDDIEITESLQLPMCHSLNWVRANAGVAGQGAANLILDESKWGTPSPGQVVARHWDWKLSDENGPRR